MTEKTRRPKTKVSQLNSIQIWHIEKDQDGVIQKAEAEQYEVNGKKAAELKSIIHRAAASVYKYHQTHCVECGTPIMANVKQQNPKCENH